MKKGHDSYSLPISNAKSFQAIAHLMHHNRTYLRSLALSFCARILNVHCPINPSLRDLTLTRMLC